MLSMRVLVKDIKREYDIYYQLRSGREIKIRDDQKLFDEIH